MMGKTKQEKREERAERQRQAEDVGKIFMVRMAEHFPAYVAAAQECIVGKSQEEQVGALATAMALNDSAVALLAEMVILEVIVIAKTPVDRAVVNELSEEVRRLVNGHPTPMGTVLGLAQDHLLRRRQLAHALHQAEVAAGEGAEEAN